MLRLSLLAPVLCLLASSAAAEVSKPAARVTPAVTDHRCVAGPVVRVAGFRHKRSKLIARAGGANHRGIDLIATEDDKVQRFAGKLAYTRADKDLEDEDAEVFACLDKQWRSVGGARTDDDGRFSIALEGAARLPGGMRDLYVAALGDGSGAWFVGYVAVRGAPVVVTDVDGTITWSENSIIKSAIKGSDIKHRPDAPAGFTASPYPIVYVTARGDVFTELTRTWLEGHGFPRGLLRLSHGAFARPGEHAIEYKTSILKTITIPIAAGIGNRKSDITAYSNVGVPGKRILIYLPAYEQEVRADLDAGRAIGFTDYRQLPALLAAP